MKVAQFYSHLNGWEFLQVRRPGMWDEIVSVVAEVDATACKTKVSRERRMEGLRKYDPRAMNARFSALFRSKGWEESRVSYWVTSDHTLIQKTMLDSPEAQKKTIEDAGREAIFSYNQTDFVRERIALEVQFGKYAFVAYDLFVKHLAFFVRGEIELGIEILPMKSMQAEMSSGPAYYEAELYNLIRNGRGVPHVPLILIGIEP